MASLHTIFHEDTHGEIGNFPGLLDLLKIVFVLGLFFGFNTNLCHLVFVVL
jgi:hypothetical protein